MEWDTERPHILSVRFDQAVSARLLLLLHKLAGLAIRLERGHTDLEAPAALTARGAELLEKCPDVQGLAVGGCLQPLLSMIPTSSAIQLLVKYSAGCVSWEEMIGQVTDVARIRNSSGVPLERIEVVSGEEHPKAEEPER
jgi:hypothetical protein